MEKLVKQNIEEILNRNIVLEKPKNISYGHYSTPIAFSLAKEFKKSPFIIAQELSKKFSNHKLFKKVEAVQGFLNFTLTNNFLEDLANKALEQGDLYTKENLKNKKILLEFVSANPTGPLHIGHARGAILGDTLANLGNHLGYSITKEYYINDAGSQMDLLGISVCLAGLEFLYKEKITYPQVYYRGEYLVDIAKETVKKFGKNILYDESKYKDIALFAKDLVLDIIIRDLKDLKIEFNNFVSEQSLYFSWNEIKEMLEKNDYLFEKDNKIYLKSIEYGDDSNRVVVRDNGIPTYLAGDIIYHKNKYDRKFDKYINIWGADHHGYIKRVKASINFLGNDDSSLEIILSQMVSLLKGGQAYKMSKRTGNTILMSDITKDIGSDALRFIFLTKKADTHLEFDVDRLKNHDSSNPVFYINYAYARINQVFKKANLNFDDVKDENFDNLNQDALNLVYESLRLSTVLNDAFDKKDTQKITDYLYFLASLIHQFYNEYKLIGSKEQNKYLKVLSMCALSLKIALDLLGIKAKEVM